MSDPNHAVLIGPNSMALIGQNCAFWLVIMEPLHLVSTDANENIAAQFQLDRIGLNPLVKIQYENSFTGQQRHSAEG